MTYYREDPYDFDADVADLKNEARSLKAYQNQLLAHPDCQDPDHPGCDACEGEDDES